MKVSFIRPVGSVPQTPAAVQGVVATVISSTEIDLTWTAIAGAQNYTVRIFGNPVVTLPVTTAQFTMLAPQTQYSFTVAAINTFGEGPQSAPVLATTLTAVQPPVQVTGLTATPVSTSEIDLTWGTALRATTYVVNRNGSPLTTVSTTSFNDTSLTQATLYQYTITATNSAGSAPASASVSATTFAAETGGTAKWNPGHWTESDTVLGTTGTLATIKGEIDAIASLPNIVGHMVLVYWGFLQQQSNTYTFTELDNIVAYIKSKGKRWSLQVVAGIFNYGTAPPNSASNGPVPAYINNGNTSTWGTAGYRITSMPLTVIPSVGATSATMTAPWRPVSQNVSIKFGTGETHTATMTQGSANFTWSGGITSAQTSANINFNVTQVLSGQSGWWGGDGNGHTYGAALWRPNVMAEWIKLHQALGSKYESDPSMEVIFQGEDSFYQGTGSTNNSDYNDATQRQNWMNFLKAQDVAWPTTNVGFSETFLQTQPSSITMTNFITDTGKPWTNKPPLMGQTDALGAVQRSAIHTWGSQTFAGQLGTLGDRRPTRRFISEIQAPDIGFFKNAGAPREDVKAGLDIMKCTHAFWAIVPSPTAQAALPNRYPITFASSPSGTSGTLSTPWPLNSGTYDLVGGAGGNITATKGSTAVTFTAAQSTGSVATSVKYPLVPSNWSNGGTATAAQNGTSRSYTDTGLLAWINDPANALQNSAYPADYP